jgi:hypothetical protein
MKRLIFILMCLVLAYPAKAQNPELTAQNLYDMCSDNSQHAKTLCETWIYGFARGMQFSEQVQKSKHLSPVTCLSEKLTGEQARLIIEKYMRDHPERLHFPAAIIAGFALDFAFPCK